MAIAATATNTIWLYCDLGAGPKCIENTIFSCNKMLSPTYTVQRVYAKDIIETLPKLKGDAHPKVIIFPGGGDMPYHDKLKGTGCSNIREYVENGGNYLGLCAGGYFGTNQIFFKFGDTPWSAKRELSFHDALKCDGPILAAYDVETNGGIEAALIRVSMLNDQEFNVYYHGGGHFYFGNNGKDKIPNNWTVLARYSEDQHPECNQYVEQHLKSRKLQHLKSGKSNLVNSNDICSDQGLIAIIHGQFGGGHVILTGVHPEFDPALFSEEDMKSTPELKTLKKGNNISLRLQLLQRMFFIFGIRTEEMAKL